MERILNSKAPNSVSRAVSVLCNGGICALPTETVYGLAGCFNQEKAIQKIFEVKNRPPTNPLILHVSSWEMLNSVAEIPVQQLHIVKRIFESFCPGPITLLLPRKNHILSAVTSGQNLVAVRMPKNDFTLQVIEALGMPIVAPSANLSNHVSPTCAEHVLSDFKTSDFLIFDDGNCSMGIESTILEIGDYFKIRRLGLISQEQISSTVDEFFSKPIFLDNQTKEFKKQERMLTPGQNKTHYAIQADTFLTEASFFKKKSFEELVLKKSVFCLDFNSMLKHLENRFFGYFDLSSTGSISQATKNYYALLRQIEVLSPEVLLLPHLLSWNVDFKNIQNGLYLALLERMLKSASGKCLA
jgi:L-threonylcarbamoyladenylate synthase